MVPPSSPTDRRDTTGRRAGARGRSLAAGRPGTRAARRLAAVAGALATAVALAACGTTTGSTSSFSGPSKQVAEAISTFQSDATALDSGKICKELLAAEVTKRLEAKGATCEKAIKSALEQVDNYSVTVKTIEVKGASATARVKSTVYGKEQAGTMSLVKEGGDWKLTSLG